MKKKMLKILEYLTLFAFFTFRSPRSSGTLPIFFINSNESQKKPVSTGKIRTIAT